MALLSGLLIGSLLCLSLVSGWHLILRSTGAAQTWRQEVRRGTDQLKGGFHLPGKWRPRGHFSSNQSGSLEALGCACLLALVFALALQALVWQRRLSEVRRHLHQTLCLKHVILETEELVKRINTLNAAIVAGEVSSWALILVGIGIAARPQWEQVKKALQLAQDAQWLKSEAEFLALKRQGCALALPLLASPYRWYAGLGRGADGRALLREHRQAWFLTTPLARYGVSWHIPSELKPSMTWEVR